MLVLFFFFRSKIVLTPKMWTEMCSLINSHGKTTAYGFISTWNVWQSSINMKLYPHRKCVKLMFKIEQNYSFWGNKSITFVIETLISWASLWYRNTLFSLSSHFPMGLPEVLPCFTEKYITYIKWVGNVISCWL